MIDSFDPKLTEKPLKRCSRCDRETEHYNLWFDPAGVAEVVCWECKAREEKGFFAHRSFGRGARGGYIPR
ncbi:MAG TPA: hypothetical protein PKD26_01225 [Pyrinomonadaceae bacterium]|nr:hypothetical protein [Pyrinomonadaceae bacterium]